MWMARFVNAQVPEVVRPFWAALQRGELIADAAVQVGTRWVAACGGVRPRRGRHLKGRCLSFAEREEIALGRAGGETIRGIARRLGRSPSTISRELRRNADRRDGGYRATTAHALAYERASRPKPAKLATNLALREIVQHDLIRRFSPEQIAGRLRRQFPDQPEMWVSAETIYQSLYVQSRGALRRELTRCLRIGRALRKPGRQPGQRKNRIPDMVHHQRAAPGGRRAPGPRPLGGRPADRQAQPDGDRHARRALKPATWATVSPVTSSPRPSSMWGGGGGQQPSSSCGARPSAIISRLPMWTLMYRGRLLLALAAV
jgi:transposase, IS30 family